MTREELKAHCERVVWNSEFLAHNGHGTLDNNKIYEEHKLILELLEQVERQSYGFTVNQQELKELMSCKLSSPQPEIIRCEDCIHNGSFDTDCPIRWPGKEYCNFAEGKEDLDCNSCEYQDEVDGSNCYECVKGIHNNYKAEAVLDKIRDEILCNIVEDDTSGNIPNRLRADWDAANKAHMIDIAIIDRYRTKSEKITKH